ncbi:Putative 3-methyladenine DNA glycosylase [Paludisphaera borealis]|uniref:Putative 3-methyladenine DNA glycosylase n=2 Tax=Paludisphaera borealis TaxID=1387353 RepID=A0A1U7CKW9_9BACT|nr:DNA-3-methyladenine glycosylase [Paludisphaera borealis]APW59571.1 Putative 3-methyladenine DNA glycosylase [Paludisphaera borealis]
MIAARREDSRRQAAAAVVLIDRPDSFILDFMNILPRDFYDHNAEQVAPKMLGKWLVHRVDGIDRIGRIVEVEAYVGPHDLAAHSSKGRTARTEVMFGEPGHAYVYLIYGMYNCLNAVTGPGEHASAVLIRALEPVSGIEGATNGPGRLCRALSIDRSLNGHDLLGGVLYIARPEGRQTRFKVVAGPRVGVDYAGDWVHRPLRFTIEGNPFLSRR